MPYTYTSNICSSIREFRAQNLFINVDFFTNNLKKHVLKNIYFISGSQNNFFLKFKFLFMISLNFILVFFSFHYILFT